MNASISSSNHGGSTANRPSSRLGSTSPSHAPIDNSKLLKTSNSHISDSLIRTNSRILERPTTSSGMFGRPGLLNVDNNGEGGGPQSSDLGTASYIARVDRKRTEYELQILLNRVSLLRAEEQKGLNKITETKMRAKELLVLKKRDEEANQSRIAQELRKREAIQEMADKAAEEKERRRQKLAENKKLLLDSKIMTVQEQRETNRKNEEIKRLEKEQIEIDRKNAIQAEKERHRLQKMKLEKEREDKIRQTKLEFQERAEEECRRKQESEQIIEELEKEEKELLHRLAKTQALQEKAYSILQRTLNS